LALASALVITHVHKSLEGDVRFPALDRDAWREITHDEHAATADDDAAFAFVTYERAAPDAAARG